MTTITIRNVPTDTRDVLASRAAALGWSLQEFLLHELVDLARRPSPEMVIASIRERKRVTGSALPSDVILRHRDAGRP